LFLTQQVTNFKKGGVYLLEKIIRKWWFYVFCILLLFIPSIVQQQVSSEKASLIVQEVMQNPLIYKVKEFFPIAKLLIVLLLIGGFIWNNMFIRPFSILVSILLTFIMIFQNISLDTSFGYVILLGNILLQLVVILSWINEIRVCKNDFSKPILHFWNIIIFILAFISFWMPTQYGKMYFSIKDLFMNESGLTYCMVTPIIISILLLYYPNVNKMTLRITAFVGFLFGILNMITWFILNTDFWWMGIVHLPLLIISFIGLILSKKHVHNFNNS